MALLLTVGHSSRSLEELVRLLRDHLIATLIDVRRYAGSRRHPQFGMRRLAERLIPEGTGYFHEPELGGMRRPLVDSPNNALDDAFRGYADHMRTATFRAAFERVAALARRETIALMCAEANHEHCHRRYLADAFQTAGFDVRHITGPRRSVRHVRHPALRQLADGSLVYRIAEQLPLFR